MTLQFIKYDVILQGVNAHSVTDVKLLNSIFTDCAKDYKSINVKELRLGYPINFWKDIGDEVSSADSPHQRMASDMQVHGMLHMWLFAGRSADLRETCSADKASLQSCYKDSQGCWCQHC